MTPQRDTALLGSRQSSGETPTDEDVLQSFVPSETVQRIGEDVSEEAAALKPGEPRAATPSHPNMPTWDITVYTALTGW